jgi:transcription antitermination factor NusG
MPKHEKKVSARLANLALNSFLPARKTLKSWNGRKKYVEEPLFPSYVFVYLEDVQGYWKGMSVEGCLSYVKFGRELAYVSEKVVNSIKLAVEYEGVVHISDREFAEGRRIVLPEGRLGGMPFEIVEYNGTESIILRVAPLRHNLLLEVPGQYVVKEFFEAD